MTAEGESELHVHRCPIIGAKELTNLINELKEIEDGDELIEDYLAHKEPVRDSYIRIYVNDTSRRTALDPFFPTLKRILELSDEPGEFFLLHIDW